MFNDKYGLTQAVLEGRKTMTRRVLKDERGIALCEAGYTNLAIYRAPYMIGETVAIAQSYKNCCKEPLAPRFKGQIFPPYPLYDNLAGWDNKMYVKAELMPHHIRITKIRVERLQDISDEDCISEGVLFYNNRYWTQGLKRGCTSEIPQVPFRYMIDKISGNGTWNSNPYVFVYEFELVD